MIFFYPSLNDIFYSNSFLYICISSYFRAVSTINFALLRVSQRTTLRATAMLYHCLLFANYSKRKLMKRI